MSTALLQLKIQATLAENLEGWRKFLDLHSPELSWSDDHYQAVDINAARMRAKYYGAKYIINRPSLYAALHYEHASVSVRPAGSDNPAPPLPSSIFKTDSPGMASRSPGSGDRPSVRDLLPEIRTGVENCIHAAIRSTTAFDKVPGRLVVTNIFGTAHA